MKTFVAELKYLQDLYNRFKAEVVNSAQNKNPEALIESILKNGELLARIEQMTSRAGQLAQEWAKLQPGLDPRSLAEIQALAATVKSQAGQLEQLCKGLVSEIDVRKSGFEAELAEIRKGTRYLGCVKPPSTNYPKFVDSVG